MTKDCRRCGKLMVLIMGKTLPDYCWDCGSGQLLRDPRLDVMTPSNDREDDPGGE